MRGEMMAIKENQTTIRSQNYQKFWVTNFGIHHTVRTVSIDLGNERTILPNEESANVAECNLVMDFIAFKLFVNLLNYQLSKIEEEYGEVDLEEEERQVKLQEEKNKEKQAELLAKLTPPS